MARNSLTEGLPYENEVKPFNECRRATECEGFYPENGVQPFNEFDAGLR